MAMTTYTNNSTMFNFNIRVPYKPPDEQAGQRPLPTILVNPKLGVSGLNRPIIVPQRALAATKVEPSTHKKKAWGEHFWYFFHTMSHKMKDESFPLIKSEFLNLCYTICCNLPCPYCTDHAKAYMKNVNFNAIQTKEQMKDLFFHFHNSVNQRERMPIFPRSSLDEKYSKAITAHVIASFMHHFRDKQAKSTKMLANDMFRGWAVNNVAAWLRVNMQHFD
jgi:hypothetical protein